MRVEGGLQQRKVLLCVCVCARVLVALRPAAHVGCHPTACSEVGAEALARYLQRTAEHWRSSGLDMPR